MSDVDRRSFLRWMAASPLAGSLAACVDSDAAAQDAPAAARMVSAEAEGREAPLVTSAADALDIFDLERVAEHNIPLAHWAYLQTGTDDEVTLHRNREGFERLWIRPRRLVGVADVDTRISLFGREWPSPVVLAPVGSHRAFHPDAELATARGCRGGRPPHGPVQRGLDGGGGRRTRPAASRSGSSSTRRGAGT